MNLIGALTLTFGFALGFNSVAQAETTYTTLEETPVRDEAEGVGSTIIAKLKSGTMIETIKEVGAYTAISFIQDGKVKTGYIATSQIKNDPNRKPTVPETPRTATPQTNADLTDENVSAEASPAKPESEIPTAKVASPPIVRDDQASLSVTQLDHMAIPAADLAIFAKNGKLIERKPKARQ